jgi:hypothetical protein
VHSNDAAQHAMSIAKDKQANAIRPISIVNHCVKQSKSPCDHPGKRLKEEVQPVKQLC